MVLHHQILSSLAIAANAEAILMQTSAEQVPSLNRVARRYLKLVVSCDFWSHANIFTDIFRAVGDDLALFCADFSSMWRCPVYESVSEDLELTIAAAKSRRVRDQRRSSVVQNERDRVKTLTSAQTSTLLILAVDLGYFGNLTL